MPIAANRRQRFRAPLEPALSGDEVKILLDHAYGRRSATGHQGKLRGRGPRTVAANQHTAGQPVTSAVQLRTCADPRTGVAEQGAPGGEADKG